MPTARPDPIRPTSDEARALARRLLHDARHGALGVLDPDTGPLVTRVAAGWDSGAALVLVSTLALHTRALLQNPACSLLVGEPGPKGDPLTHPRLSLQARAERAPKDVHRDRWLLAHPKTTLYFDFADFLLLRLVPTLAHLNGGFGQAFRLLPEDLRDPPEGPPGAP
jgi:hypothetical protein